MTTYTYNIATSFHGVEPNINKLILEIQNAAIPHELAGTSDDGIDVFLTFDNSLNGPELTILDGIVDVHTPDIPLSYSKITSNITTNTTDTYQVANTVNIYAFENDKYKIEFEYVISSTLTGLDVLITIDDNQIYSNNQTLGGSLLGNRINIGTFELVDLTVGLHKLDLKFRRAGALSASTIYRSKLYATNLNL